MNERYNEYALLFKALSDPNRLLIIDYLLESECCACVILEQLKITQSTLSYHMKILCESSIVNVRKEGKWMYYSLNKTKFEDLREILERFSNGISGNTLKWFC
ncbi:MAG: metalloregulator ArsR/SmtB family transcription factor [Anaerocolumna sp.]